MIEYVYLAMLTEKSFVCETTDGINVIGNIKKTMQRTKEAAFNEPIDDSEHSSELNPGAMAEAEGKGVAQPESYGELFNRMKKTLTPSK